jgi:hypothetical protein
VVSPPPPPLSSRDTRCCVQLKDDATVGVVSWGGLEDSCERELQPSHVPRYKIRPVSSPMVGRWVLLPRKFCKSSLPHGLDVIRRLLPHFAVVVLCAVG